MVSVVRVVVVLYSGVSVVQVAGLVGVVLARYSPTRDHSQDWLSLISGKQQLRDARIIYTLLKNDPEFYVDKRGQYPRLQALPRPHSLDHRSYPFSFWSSSFSFAPKSSSSSFVCLFNTPAFPVSMLTSFLLPLYQIPFSFIFISFSQVLLCFAPQASVNV